MCRLLRCNRLCIGGIDYPVVFLKYDDKSIIFKKIAVKYWYIKIDKYRFYQIKNLTKKLNNKE